jgi:hypothetical protein
VEVHAQCISSCSSPRTKNSQEIWSHQYVLCILDRQSGGCVCLHNAELRIEKDCKCTDVRTAITFYVLLEKISDECHNLLKESFRTHIPLCENVLWCLNPFNARFARWEDLAHCSCSCSPTTATDAAHVKHMCAVSNSHASFCGNPTNKCV